MNVDEHIDALAHDGVVLVGASRSADLETAVPSCPGWRLRDLLAHIGYVHRWAATYVSEGLTEMVDEPDEAGILAAAPTGDAIRDWVEEGHTSLVRILSCAPPDLSCWTFLSAPSPLAMWARRQAHETAIHRADAQLAAGQAVTAFDTAFAVDGIEEIIFGFLSRRAADCADVEPIGTLELAPTDAPDRWTLRILERAVEAARQLTSCDVVIRAPASDLYLWLWNRDSTVSLQTTGDTDLLGRWRTQFQVTWS
ncbi:MAG: maleylpyruvate isomerase family mycothiol-dependent enzyme [Acidimicrobiales bacterium]